MSYGRSQVMNLLISLSKRLIPSDKPRVAQVRIGDVALLVLANEDVGRRLFLARRYEWSDWQFLAGQMRDHDICVDVGANTGFYTMLMAAVAVQGEVHAFEPVPLNWHLLSAAAVINGFSHVRAINSALGDTVGTNEFSVSTDGAYSSFLPTGRKLEADQLMVKVDTLDGYLEGTNTPRVDILKIDVEGAEMIVLAGAHALLTTPERRPRLVLLELFGQNLAPYRTSIHEIVAFMRECHYEPFWITARGVQVPFTAQQYDKQYNVFFQPVK